MTYLLALDQGTTSSRAILFDSTGQIIKVSQKNLKLFHPQKGWVEQNPEDILEDTLAVARDAMIYKPAAMGITNQRETTIIWNRKTGKAIYNAIVWQDRRTTKICEDLKTHGFEGRIRNKTGLLLDPYFSAPKIKWILDNVPDARMLAQQGDLAFGTIDTFLLWHLTGGKLHATDATNASRTMLFNINTQQWDEELLSIFDIPKALLPDVRDTVSDFGKTEHGIFTFDIPIHALIGDQQGALVGQCCFDPGQIKSTYGTGCFALMNMGKTFKLSNNRLLTTIAYRINGEVTYALEGSIFIAGAAIQWLRDNLGIIDNTAQTELLARSVDNSNDVFFVPSFSGFGAPYWQPNARAAILGMTRETTKAHIVRAALEAQAFQTKDLIDAFIADTHIIPQSIRADGGLMNNSFVAQSIADVLGINIDIPNHVETTAWGAASLAGLGAGIYSGLHDMRSCWKAGHVFHPQTTTLQGLYKGWLRAIHALERLSSND